MKTEINSLVVHSYLLKSGFVPNEDKSQWEPIQIITWLGVILNTTEGSIKATDERIAKLSYDFEILSAHQHPTRVHVKCVAIIAGQIISLSSCVSPVVSWGCEVFLTRDAISEIDLSTP